MFSRVDAIAPTVSKELAALDFPKNWHKIRHDDETKPIRLE
jgi:hypothetical protein